MRIPDWKKLYSLPRERPGFVEAAAILMTAVLFIFTYWSRSQDLVSELAMEGMFLLGALVLVSIVIYGVMVRHFLPFISHIIVVGSCMIGISRVTATLSRMPAFQNAPLFGPEGWGYLVHHDDMLLYPGFILMLGGFYLSILHAAHMRQELVREAKEKEQALQRSEKSAALLARRVAIENIATSISTRFINLSHDEIDREIDRSLAELGLHAKVDRAFISFSRMVESAPSENFEWCAPGVPSYRNAMSDVPLKNFAWGIARFRRGDCIAVSCLDDLPPEAAFEKAWFAGQDTQSVLNVPIISNKNLQGYIGFDSVSREVAWPEETESFLRMIGEILLCAWDRRCSERQRYLLELQVQQARKLESLGVMAGGIAHDFNNLLTGIMGNAELAQLDVGTASDSHRYLEGVIQSSRRAAELCRQMLAYAGRGKFITELIDLNDLISKSEMLLSASLSGKTDLLLELADDLPDVAGDVGQFRQVLGNLVTNAAESIGDRRGTVAIRTSHRFCSESFLRGTYLAEPLAPGDYICLEVQDTGSGMTHAVKGKVFEPFYSTRFAGRGLGLPAVLGIVRSHRGAINVETELGVGTTVQLYFPLNSAELTHGLITGERRGNWHGQGTVLLADDEDLVISVGSMMLRHLGLDVVTASSGDEVVERARTHAASLQCVILDYEMPGSDVLDVCGRLRAILPGIPIVIASGHGHELVAERFGSDDIAAFLPKPFELSELQETLRRFLVPAAEAE